MQGPKAAMRRLPVEAPAAKIIRDIRDSVADVNHMGLPIIGQDPEGQNNEVSIPRSDLCRKGELLPFGLSIMDSPLG